MNSMQHEFDAVVAHLYKQGKPAVSSDPSGPGCYYRITDADGATLSCAVGCRIPDAVYDSEMDQEVGVMGTGLTSLLRRFKAVLPAEIVAYEDMFDRLQGVHDGEFGRLIDGKFDLNRLELRLTEVATDCGLTFTKPQVGA